MLKKIDWKTEEEKNNLSSFVNIVGSFVFGSLFWLIVFWSNHLKEMSGLRETDQVASVLSIQAWV